MHKRLKLFTPVSLMLMLLSVALCAMLYGAGDATLFYFASAMVLTTFVVALVLLRRAHKQTGRMLDQIAQDVLYTLSQDYSEFPIPVLIAYGEGEVVWSNQLCAQEVFGGRDARGEDIGEVFKGTDLKAAAAAGRADLEHDGKQYTAYIATRRHGEEEALIFYLVENTKLKFYASEYHRTKPTIVLLVVDNYDEMTQDYKESERAQLLGEIENVVEKYFQENHGYVLKINRDRFLAFVEERGFERMLADKFTLLDRVREIQGHNRMSATLSIGVGRDAADLYEGEASARQAVDMCLGRGGDQAAIKNQNGYEFYGGVSKGIEKRTKVKTRIIAAALGELIESSGNVIIMGHRFADLDALGSAVGLLRAVKEMGKHACIAIDPYKNLVRPLLDKLLVSGYNPEDFIAPDDALDFVEPDTLLIVVDTHVPHVLESEELYRACSNVVVIDHHRKLVGHIDNAVIFFHEPYASSASEMVTELVQYFPGSPKMNRIEAEAMMAGIMLDTKNFVMRTGVRTFEAAAYLRRLGADTVEVRKLFSSSMDAYQQKTSLVSTAEVYKGCAIAVSDAQFDGIQVVAPQAADELMTINGVDASFVVYVAGNSVNVSARSMGLFNVQVIMEKLGGGGHQTMAAAQFPGERTEHVREMLIQTIDEVVAERGNREQQVQIRQQEAQ